MPRARSSDDPVGESSDESPPVPQEPDGKELTARRERQKQGREAAAKLWQEILTNIQKVHRGND